MLPGADDRLGVPLLGQDIGVTDMPPATTNAVRRTQGKRPGDLTGLRNQQLAKEAAATKAEKQAEVKEALEAQRIAKLTTEVDYTSDALAEAAKGSDVVEGEVEVKAKTRRIRVIDDIHDMTFGREVLQKPEYDEHGNVTKPARIGSLRHMSFETGPWYTVDADLADHLEYLGYVYSD